MKGKVCKIMSLLFIALFVLFAANPVRAVSTLAPTASISLSTHVTNGAGNMAYDSGKGEVFIGSDNGGVLVLSDSTNKVTTTIDAAVGYLTYDSGKGEIFDYTGDATAEGETPMVQVISDSANAIVANITSSSWWVPM